MSEAETEIGNRKLRHLWTVVAVGVNLAKRVNCHDHGLTVHKRQVVFGVKFTGEFGNIRRCITDIITVGGFKNFASR
jgi:hypothetical protein